MKKEENNLWQKHLDELEQHYAPEKFFADEFSRPTDEADVKENFFTPTLFEEADIPEQGELTIDIYHDDDNLYILAPVAGVKPEEIEINIDKDVLTIRGKRENSLNMEKPNYVYKECYWGNFSRSVILPVPVKEEEVKANFKNGVLKITLPKKEESKGVKIRVEEEEF